MKLKLYQLSITTSILSALLTGCATQMERLQEIGKQPALAQVKLPMEKDNFEPLDVTDEYENKPQYANSLWQPGARTFFKDMKARRVGDILTVTVKIKDKAQLDNETKRSRDSTDTAAAPTMLGIGKKVLGLIPGGANPDKLLDLASKTNSDGKGNIARGETIETEVAAMVTQILPNGNLVIHADQEIGVNFEVRKVTVDGVVRPEDISSLNSIDSDQIAEARIAYGGRGQMTDIQQPRIGSQIMDIISPF
jgi:flagellar L-ring protein precursor FlgH